MVKRQRKSETIKKMGERDNQLSWLLHKTSSQHEKIAFGFGLDKYQMQLIEQFIKPITYSAMCKDVLKNCMTSYRIAIIFNTKRL